jgi:hypothetical protein
MLGLLSDYEDIRNMFLQNVCFDFHLTAWHYLAEYNSSYRIGLKLKTKLHGLSPRANYTERATAACRRSDCQLLRIEGATWSV